MEFLSRDYPRRQSYVNLKTALREEAVDNTFEVATIATWRIVS